MIWLITLVMTVSALAIVFVPLLRTLKVQSEYRTEQNIMIARERLKSLQQQKQQGELTDEEFQFAKSEIENSLHNDLKSETQAGTIALKPDYKTSGVLLIVMPVLIFSLYYFLGNADLSKSEWLHRPLISNTQNPEPINKVPDVKTLFESLRQRLEKNPDDGQGWIMMGLSYMHFGQYEEAVSAYQRAVQLLPDNSNALAGLQRAKDAISGKKALTSAPVISKKMTAPNGQTVDVGAMVMRLRKKLEANPDNLQGWLMLARSYKHLGLVNDAIDAYQQALKIRPDDPQIISMLDELNAARDGAK